MQSVIATFDDPAIAKEAVESLIADGFYPESVHLQSSADPLPAREPAQLDAHGLPVDGGDDTFLAGVGRFFSQLFESHGAEDASNYAEAVKRGSSVVIVDAKDDAEVVKATDVMDDMGAVNVEERAETWKSQGWTGFNAESAYDDEDAVFARQSVLVVQEQSPVGTRTMNVGGLRVIKRLSDTPVSDMVKLHGGPATIERPAVDRATSDGDVDPVPEDTRLGDSQPPIK